MSNQPAPQKRSFGILLLSGVFLTAGLFALSRLLPPIDMTIRPIKELVVGIVCLLIAYGLLLRKR